MRPVLFVKYYDKASTVLAADQVSEALRQRGYRSESAYPDRLRELRNGIAVFIKTSRLHHVLRARLAGNRTVLDVHDTVIFKARLKNDWLLDGLILRSQRAYEDFHRRGRNDTGILLHWDPRFRPHAAGTAKLEIAYLGDRRSLYLWDQIPGVACIDSDYFEQARRFNCHLSIRRPGRESLYKPAVKVSTAGACGAALITTRDEGALELLGWDYPYYTGHRLGEIQRTILRVRETLGSESWQLALRKLTEATERTSLDRLIPDYVRYFESLS